MKTIAISGKGGTGKSTVAALIIRWLAEKQDRPILAVDADANVNLNDILGIQIKETVGSIREELKAKSSSLPAGMTKGQFLEYKIQSSLVETPKYDLLAMGRPEGPGCYCYANNLLRDIIHTLSALYSYVIIDNEAGMEHLSRRTTQNIDHLVIVTDSTPRGAQTAVKICSLLQELEVRVGEKWIVFNRVHAKIPENVKSILEGENTLKSLTVPEDIDLLEADQKGRSIWSLPGTSPALTTIGTWMGTVFHGAEKGQ